MSTFSFSADFGPDALTRNYEAMTGWTMLEPGELPPFAAGSAAAIAVSAGLGLGLAGQMTGTMFGLWQGMMAVSMKSVGADPAVLDALAWPAAETLAPATRAIAKTEIATEVDVVPMEPTAKTARAPRAAGRKAKAATRSTVAKLKSDADTAAAAARENVRGGPEAAGSLRQASVLEPEDFQRPAEVEKPDRPDDLKMISGIGPKLEQVLNSLGIWTFAQIAAWTVNEIAWIDDYLQFSGRIERDGWIAQAKALAEG